jgi:hypothetical protein
VVPWHAATVGEVEAFLAVRSTRAGDTRDDCTVAARAIVLKLQRARLLLSG